MSFELIAGSIICVIIAAIVAALLAIVAMVTACEVLPVFMDVSGFINLDRCR